jgi:hypothetical protein
MGLSPIKGLFAVVEPASAVGDLNRAIWAAISAGTITSVTTMTASAGTEAGSKRRLS